MTTRVTVKRRGINKKKEVIGNGVNQNPPLNLRNVDLSEDALANSLRIRVGSYSSNFNTELERMSTSVLENNIRKRVDETEYKLYKSGLAFMYINRYYLIDIMESGYIQGISSNVIKIIWKAVRKHFKSKTSVLKYSPLRVFYIMLSIFIVTKSKDIINNPDIVLGIESINGINRSFMTHNRAVVRSLIRLGSKSRYWKDIEAYVNYIM